MDSSLLTQNPQFVFFSPQWYGTFSPAILAPLIVVALIVVALIVTVVSVVAVISLIALVCVALCLQFCVTKPTKSAVLTNPALFPSL